MFLMRNLVLHSHCGGVEGLWPARRPAQLFHILTFIVAILEIVIVLSIYTRVTKGLVYGFKNTAVGVKGR